MKKFLSVVLALLMVFSISQIWTFKASADQSGDFTYFISDSKATITKYTGAGGTVTIPNAFGVYPVTSIGYQAFSGCTGISALTIPDSVTTIDESAFSNCTGIDGIIIGNGVTTIGASAFEGCTTISKISIPKSVSAIGNYAFNGCTSLTSIFVASSNSNFSSQYGVLYNKTKTILIQYPHAKGGSLIIPNSVTSFGSRAFYDCDHITSVAIPNSMTSIGADAFSGCSNLTAVAISNSVTSIGNYAFNGCIALKKLTIPNSVTTIGSSAFFGCSLLTGVTVGSGVTAINNSAFSGCNLLTAAYFLGNAPTLGTDAFKNSAQGFKLYYISGKTGFTNPLSGYATAVFVMLGLPVFSASTTSPTSAPVTVTITYPTATTKEYKLNEGHWTTYTAPITVYTNDIVYAKCLDAASKPSPVASTTINNIAVEGFNYMVTNSAAAITGYIGSGGAITIPATLGGYPVTSIGNNAFQNCTTLTGVTFGSGVVSIGDYAFSGCTGLKGLEFGNSITTLGRNAFSDCAELTKVEIGNSITSLGINAFGGCSGLIGVSIGNGLSVISDYAFSNCIALSKVTIGSGVTNIAYGAFLNCKSLTEVTIPIGVTNIGDYAFCNCTGLKRADIPSSVLSIGENSFFGCLTLTAVTIGDKVSNIGNSAFRNCTDLTAAYFFGNAPTMGSTVFDSSSSFKVNYINGKSGFTSPWKGYTTTQFIPLATPTLSISPTLPLIEKVTVTITYPINAIINEYKIDSGDWMTYTSPVKPSSNCTVYARCTDVLGNTSSIGSLKVSNIAVDSFKYSVSNSAVTITGYTGAGGIVTIPDTLSGYPVTGIGNYAFATKPELTYVKIGKNVTNIGEGAFRNCTGLTDVSIENKVTSIGLYAFNRCENLTAVTIPESVTAINPYAFNTCLKLKAAYFLGNAPTTMSSDAFGNCPADFTVFIRTGKTGFSSPWYGVYTLIAFVPLTAPTLSKYPTLVTSGNVSVTIDFPAAANKKEYKLSTGGWTEYTAPIVLSANDTVLARYKDIDFKESETGSISVENISIGDYTYSVANSLATIKRYIGTIGVVTIPSTIGGYPVTGIGDYAFSGNVGITGVIIPDSVLNIGVAAFNNCTGLIAATIGNNVTNISDQAFAGCSKLKTVNIPDSVIDIGYGSFSNCIALTSITLGSGVTFIDSYAFSGCTLLSAAYLLGTAPTKGIAVFINTTFKYYLGGKTGFLDQWASLAAEIFTPLATPILNISSYLPTSGSTSVTITYPEDATTKEYRLSEGAWTAYTSPVVLTANDTVYARCTDLAGKPSLTTSVVVNNIEKLTVRSGSSTIINQSNRFIYGLAPGITGAEFRDNYIQISGNGKTVYTPGTTALGTGVEVELVDCTTNIILDTYSIVIFGDVNGDGNIDSIDAGKIVDVENHAINWNPTTDAAFYFAGDMNGDDNIDSMDAGIAVDVENSVRNVNQQTGLAY